MVRSSNLTYWSGSSHFALDLRSRRRFHHSVGDLEVVECILPCRRCLYWRALDRRRRRYRFVFAEMGRWGGAVGEI